MDEYNSNNMLLIHNATNSGANQRLKSRHPYLETFQKLIPEKFDATTKWNNRWKISDLDKLNVIENPMNQIPSYDFPGSNRIVLQRLGTGT